MRSQQDLNHYITQLMIGRLGRLHEDPGTEQLDADERVAEADLAAFEGRLAEARSAYARGGISLATLESVDRELAAKREMDDRLRRVRERRLPPQMLGGDVVRRWQSLELEQQRTLIKALMTVTVKPAGRGKRHFDPNDVEIEWV